MKTAFLSLLVLALLCLSSYRLFAQNDSTGIEPKPSVNINSNRKYKYEAGIDISALHLLSGNNSLGNGYSLFARRHKIITKKSNLVGVSNVKYIAYRFRIGANLSDKKLKVPDVSDIEILNPTANYYWWYDDEIYDQSNFLIRVGRERQIRNGRFELFYGYDVYFSRNTTMRYRLYTNWYNYGTPTEPIIYAYNTSYHSKEVAVNFGIAPIAGVKYFLIPRLCFSAEATFNIGYAYLKKLQTHKTYEERDKKYTEYQLPKKQQGFEARINPLYVVNIGYYF